MAGAGNGDKDLIADASDKSLIACINFYEAETDSFDKVRNRSRGAAFVQPGGGEKSYTET
jgi:hypothetical protein